MNKGQMVLKGGPQRLVDASFFVGSIKCSRCKCFNEFVVIDGEVISQETTSPEGKTIYLLEIDTGTFDLVKPSDTDNSSG